MENYSGPCITYLQGDIIEQNFQKLKEFFEKQNISIGFDKVFSLHCFHWVPNSEQWSKNIYSLLNPGGQTFVQFIAYASLMDMWIEAAFSERWIPFTKTIGPIRAEFHYSTNVNSDITKMMTNAGFIVELCEHSTYYIDKQWPHKNFLSLLQSGDPYVRTIPEELHMEYFEDLSSVYKKYQNKYAETGMPYTVVVIVASKPNN